MSNKDLNEKQWLAIKNDIYEKALEEEKKLHYHEGSIYPDFYEEIKKLGFEFEIGMQLENICRENPEITKNIILKYYKKSICDDEKGFLMACLINKKHKDLIPFFIEEFYKYEKANRDWAGNCLIQTADVKYIEEYILMLKDSKLGDSRIYIIETVEKLKTNQKEIIPSLIKLLNDDILRLSALKALSKYKEPSLLSYFEKYKNDKSSDIRNVAKKAIANIEKLSK